MRPHVALTISDTSQVGEARRVATRLAADAGLDRKVSSDAAIVATELATNLVRHASQGRMLLRATSSSMELFAIDSGPGMVNVQQCLVDGYSTGGSPGTGLGAVRRLSREFDLYSLSGSGTVVMSRMAAGATNGHRGGPGPFRWGALSTAAQHEEVCGDAWRVVEHDGAIGVMVADGLGHGPAAAEAADRAADIFSEHAADEPGSVIEHAHTGLAGTRGAAVAVAQIAANRTVRYAGCGNISGHIVDAARARGLASQNGTVGVEIRRVHQVGYEWASGFLVMHSDGLTTRWSVDAYPGIFSKHPAIVAALLYRDALRGRDDATVVVIGSGATN
jgi:anti-sigma regulatory factor (Ser/Thr protein kinase)